MEVLGNVFLKVDVDPCSIVQKLIEEAIGHNRFVVEMNNRYYIYVISGNVTVNVAEITEERYNYIQALETVLKELNKK